MTGTLAGRRYLERGRPVTVLAQWAHRPRTPGPAGTWLRPPGGAPRNVLVRREDGHLTVRPFRGLRRIPAGEPSAPAPVSGTWPARGRHM